MEIGFVGLGTMGRGIVRNLLRAGHSVTVWNRSKQKFPEELAAAKHAASIAEAIAGKTRVFVCVTGPDAQHAVFDGKDGIVAQCRQGRHRHRRHNDGAGRFAGKSPKAVAAAGATYLDTPVFGSKGEAWEGKLDFVGGGSAEAFEALKPLLEPLAQQHPLHGPVGRRRLDEARRQPARRRAAGIHRRGVVSGDQGRT